MASPTQPVMVNHQLPDWETPSVSKRKALPQRPRSSSRFKSIRDSVGFTLSQKLGRILPPDRKYFGASRRTLLIGVGIAFLAILAIVIGLGLGLRNGNGQAFILFLIDKPITYHSKETKTFLFLPILKTLVATLRTIPLHSAPVALFLLIMIISVPSVTSFSTLPQLGQIQTRIHFAVLESELDVSTSK